MFVSMHLSWFSKFVIIDLGIIDDTFKKLEDMDTLLIKRDN